MMIKRKRRLMAGGLAAGALVAGGVVMPSAVADEAVTPTIQVDASNVIRDVSSGLRGQNMVAGYQAMGAYDPETGVVDPLLASHAQQAGVTLLRFPGGTAANRFPWKDAIGPASERGCYSPWTGTGSSARGSSDLLYGVDEHMQFAESIGAETNIVVNFATMTAQDAADFVEYLNADDGQWADLRAANGHPEPYGVKWFEVGNEMNFATQGYWMDTETGAVRSEKYINGGSTTFSEQPVIGYCDDNPDAAYVSGDPEQQFFVPNPPLAPGVTTVELDGTAWTRVDDLSGAGPDEAVYTLDDQSGEILFGDGTNGLNPPVGAHATADYTTAPHDGFLDYQAAMKAVDPDIKVCSAERSSTFLEQMGSENPYDCFAVHRYLVRGALDDRNQMHDAMVGQTDTNGVGFYTDWQQQILANGNITDTGEPPVVVATEFGLNGGTGITGYRGSMEVVLNTATMIHGFVNQGIPVAQKHVLVNPCEGYVPPGTPVWSDPWDALFTCEPDFVPSATARLYELLADGLGDEQLASSIADNPVRDDYGQSLTRYEALRVTATQGRDGKVRLLVTNRDRADHTAQLDIDGVAPAAVPVKASVLHSDHFLDYNSAENPNAVSIDTSEMRVRAAGFEWTFPAHSVTTLILEPAGA